MSAYFRVSPKFWVDTRRWGDSNQLAALYLLTCQHRTTEGLYHLPPAYMAADLGLSSKQTTSRIAFLRGERFAFFDDDAEVVFVRNALKYQAPNTKDQITGAIRRLEQVPPTVLWRDFLVAVESHAPRLLSEIQVRFECDPSGTQVPVEFSSSSSSSSSYSSSVSSGEAVGGLTPPTSHNDTVVEFGKKDRGEGRGAA